MRYISLYLCRTLGRVAQIDFQSENTPSAPVYTAIKTSADIKIHGAFTVEVDIPT